ncbi:MAG: enoyl-CoA hydratase/isomerase family protein [Robiginitomaculum sp.]|nr:enoyl-CoA hydratase/isomerase family protein [Robiginitomaculum sp.]
MNSLGTDEITLKRDGEICFVCFNRPERNNTLKISTLKLLAKIVRGFMDDIETKVVIFHARGKHFSFGADLRDIQKQAAKNLPLIIRRRQMGFGAELLKSIQNIPQVTICALQGMAVGGAVAIASACDFRIGSSDCKVSYGEVKLGMPLMWQALPLCVQLVGPARAKKMIMSGQPENAKKLLDWGFLDEISDPEALQENTVKMAKLYTSLPPMAVQAIKKSINAYSSALDQAVMHMDTDQFLLLQNSKDAGEAFLAVTEKRPGIFTGD